MSIPNSDLEDAASVLKIAVETEDIDFLQRCRQVYDPDLLKLAAKQLSPEQYSKLATQIKKLNSLSPKPGDRATLISPESPSNGQTVRVLRVAKNKDFLVVRFEDRTEGVFRNLELLKIEALIGGGECHSTLKRLTV